MSWILQMLQCKPKCLSNSQTSTYGYYTKAYAEEICCLCTSFRFGSYVYTVFLSVFGMILTVADLCRTVTNGPLPLCKARQEHQNNDWFLCPRLERDLSLMGSFFNLLIYILLLLGLLAGRPMLLVPWLVYKVFLVCALLLIDLAHLMLLQNYVTKWQLLILAFNINNIIQVMCVLMSFL